MDANQKLEDSSLFAPTVVAGLIAAGREIVAHGLVRGSGGNLSGRVGDHVWITPSRADLGDLTETDFVPVPLQSPISNLQSPITQLPLSPSSELPLHLAAYTARPEADAILHVHPPKAISLGLLGCSLPALTPDFYLHLGPAVPLVPYLTPTTKELAQAAGETLEAAPAVLLQNHGVLVAGRSVQQALLRLFLLEEHAAIYLDALAAGQPRLLSPADMAALDQVTGGRYRI